MLRKYIRMPRDLVTDPGEKRDWLEKCRLNKLKVMTLLTLLTIIRMKLRMKVMMVMKHDWLERCWLKKLKVLNLLTIDVMMFMLVTILSYDNNDGHFLVRVLKVVITLKGATSLLSICTHCKLKGKMSDTFKPTSTLTSYLAGPS